MRTFSTMIVLGLLSGTDLPVNAQPTSNLSFAQNPTVQCIYHALKSSSAVQSVSLYSADTLRGFIEFTFRNKVGQVVVFDIELFKDDAIVGDRIPRDVVTNEAEARELESNLNLDSICHLQYSFDNVEPGPGPRASWEKVGWPSE